MPQVPPPGVFYDGLPHDEFEAVLAELGDDLFDPLFDLVGMPAAPVAVPVEIVDLVSEDEDEGDVVLLW